MKCECAAASKITYCLLFCGLCILWVSLLLYIIIIMCFHLRISNGLQGFFSSIFSHLVAKQRATHWATPSLLALIQEILAFIVFCDQNKCISACASVRTAHQNEMFYKYSNLIHAQTQLHFGWTVVEYRSKHMLQSRFTRLCSILCTTFYVFFFGTFGLFFAPFALDSLHKTITYRQFQFRIIPFSTLSLSLSLLRLHLKWAFFEKDISLESPSI